MIPVNESGEKDIYSFAKPLEGLFLLPPLFYPLRTPLPIISVDDMISRFSHQSVVKGEVVERKDAFSQVFSRSQEVEI